MKFKPDSKGPVIREMCVCVGGGGGGVLQNDRGGKLSFTLTKGGRGQKRLYYTKGRAQIVFG